MGEWLSFFSGWEELCGIRDGFRRVPAEGPYPSVVSSWFQSAAALAGRMQAPTLVNPMRAESGAALAGRKQGGPTWMQSAATLAGHLQAPAVAKPV